MWKTSRTRNHRARSHGFTLTDLLVLISVVTLLCLAVLPGFARSQEDSARATCLFNLKQLMQGTVMFATDNRDYLPYPNWGNSTRGWLYAPENGQPPRQLYETNALAAYKTGLVWQYVNDPGRYRCPLDTPLNRYFKQRMNQMSTYVMNGAVSGYGQLPDSGWRLAQFSPAAYCLWEPSESLGSPPIGAFAYGDASAYPDRNESASQVHPWGTPVAMFAGSAKWITWRSYYEEQNKAGLNLVWCNPGTSTGR